MVDTANVANSEFFYSNVSPITTDFNVSPYYDDFDSKNNYYKILFKPGYAIQSRELTQIQSILQDQISKFGQHVFKEGSMVLGGKFNIDTRVNYVKLKDLDLLGDTINVENFKDQIVTGQTTGIRAYVNLVLDGAESTDKPKTLYVSYLSANKETGDTVFLENETLVSNVGTMIVSNSSPTGYGSVFTINEGVRFAKEHFIYHTKQSVVVDRYDTTPNCKVGFYLIESIVNSSEDSSLLDPALESSNFSAPGADRFKIDPILTRLDIDDSAGYPDYVNLFTIENGKVIEINERPTYNVIRDELAKRTSDESGDYYVRGFNTVIEEHLERGKNGGWKKDYEGGNSQLLSIQIEPGTAYVKGYEVNKLVTEFLTTDKSTTYSNVNGQIISTPVGSYVIAKEAVGAWNLNTGQSVDLYDTAQQRISRGLSSTTAQTGKKIGSAKVKSISKDSGVLGTANGTIRIHLFDVSMLGSNSFSDVRSVYYDNTGGSDVGADIVTLTGQSNLQDPFIGLLYYTGSDYTKTIRSPDGTIDTTFFFKKSSDISITAGAFSLTSSITNEQFPYGTTTLSSSDKNDIFLTLNSSLNIALPGTAFSGTGSTTLVGSSTQFTKLNVGDRIEFSGNSKTYVIASIINDTTLTVTTNLPGVFSSNSIFKAYKAGDMIDLTNKSTSGSVPTVVATPTSLTFNLQESTLTSNGTITYSMYRNNAREVRKVLKKNRYVLIDCSLPFSGNTTGPFNLGFSDIYEVTSIRKASSFSSVNDGVDVTSNFVVDNGQRDSYYGNGRIIPYTTLTSSDKLLVCLNYFQPDYTLGVGYFSIDSYPVNDIGTTSDQITTEQIPIFTSPDTGISYDLRNFLDFRPVYTNTAADATSLSGITTNPSKSTTLQYESNGLRLPADSESVTYDYSYYLARKDIVTLNQNGDFMIIRGVPAGVPITPACPPHLMSISRIVIPPYPSLSPNYARLIGRGALACSSTRTAQVRFTMRDIGVLKQRVDNIENYVSLSLLEKSALDMKILDENGLDRFKNGIFVDSFTSFSLSDVGNPDHHICYDPREGSIRPIFETQAVGYDYYSGSNVVVKSNLLMLPYTEVVALSQPFATTYRNVETTVYRFVGKLYLDPPSDYWVNTNRLASQTFRFGATDADVTPYSIVYGSWQTTVTGVTTSDPKLISTTSIDTTKSSSSTTTKTYDLNFKYATSVSAIYSLVSMYGSSTPVTFTGFTLGGHENLGAGIDLATYFNNIKTLGDVLNNITKMTELGTFSITIAAQQTTTQTTTAKTNTFSTTTTTGTQASRTFTETFQTLQTETQSLGDKVVAVAPIADIRPQTIAFEARGVKATTRHFVYFDGQLMSDYVTPGIMLSTTQKFANTNGKLITATGAEGSALYSTENGMMYGFLRLPSDAARSFRTGTKEVIVTDSPTNQPDATSSAKAYFAAQGVTQTVQETIISTSQVVTETKSGVQTNPIVYTNTTNKYSTTSVSTNVSNTVVATGVIKDLVSCMAYSFKLNTPNGEEGTFLSSVDVFFAAKDPNLGVWFEVRAMDNGGTITKVQVPDSEVWLSSSDVNIPTNNIPVATNVKFKAPIFLQNNQEYAFIIHTEGINPNYYMYVCVLGENDIVTRLPVNSRPLTGTLFTTNNNTDWDQVPRVDLKCTFYRAKFSTGVVGEAILGNEHREYVQLPLTPVTGANTSWFGERILGNDILTVQALSPVGATVSVGDYLIGANTGTNTSINTVLSTTSYKMNNTGYALNEDITVRRANGLLTTITTKVTSKETATGRIYKVTPKNDTQQFNGNTAIMVIDSTNGAFNANDTLHMEYSGNTVSSLELTKQPYSAVQFEPSFIDFLPTTCDFTMETRSNTGALSGYQSIVNSNITDFDTEMALYSRTTEVKTYASEPSNKVKIRMTTVSDYMTPVVNLDRTYTVYINNLINSNTANELLPSGGSLKNKYISQVINLAEGQDAEDLTIILSAYKPPQSNSDIKVYVRVSHGEDFESIYFKNWIEMESFNNSVYSTKANRKDWREFQYKFPDSVMTGRNDQDSPIIQYTNSVGTVFEGFKQYQIKIGLQSDTSAIYPRVADLRAIALQK